MTKIDAMIAPRALLAEELASVVAPHLIAYGLANRAFTHANIWDAADDATIHAAEQVLADTVEAAERSMKEWLSDMQADGQPRFYQAAGLKKAISNLHLSAGRYFNGLSDEVVSAAVTLLTDRHQQSLNLIIERAED